MQGRPKGGKNNLSLIHILSSEAHHGADQVVMEARGYGFAKRFQPFLVSVVYSALASLAVAVLVLMACRIIQKGQRTKSRLATGLLPDDGTAAQQGGLAFHLRFHLFQ